MVLDFKHKKILAPMVRIGTLPTRLLALRYGADIVYTEEIVDIKILKSKRIENYLLGTVDYVLDDGTIVFRTCALEKERVVFQVGTCDAQRALQVAKMVESDVAAFDVNMGCPKSFSIMGGMGAALLTQPEKIKEILSTLVKNLNIPVTCKIRILPDVDATLALCKLIEDCGVSALAVHGRTRDERPRHANHDDVITKIVESLHRIPVIANGGSGVIHCYDDIDVFRRATTASSVMVARAAEMNVSVFRPEGKLSKDELIVEYLKEAIKYDNHFNNTKYCIQQILGSDQSTTEIGTALLAARDEEQIYKLWGLSGYCAEVRAERLSATLVPPAVAVAATRDGLLQPEQRQLINGLVVNSAIRDGTQVNASDFLFDKSRYNGAVSPKSILLEHAHRHGYKLEFSAYCRSGDRLFTAAAMLDGVEYATTAWHKRRQWAEQAAATVCLRILGIPDGSCGPATMQCTSSSTAAATTAECSACADGIFDANTAVSTLKSAPSSGDTTDALVPCSPNSVCYIGGDTDSHLDSTAAASCKRIKIVAAGD